MKQRANLACINPKCGKIFPIKSLDIRCDKCDFLLDVDYKDAPSSNQSSTHSTGVADIVDVGPDSDPSGYMAVT